MNPDPCRGCIVQPGERAGDVDDVLLGVAAVDAKRVQLQQLARVVLVDARVGRSSAAAVCTSRTLRTPRTLCTLLTRTQPVVEIEQHRRALRGGAEHVAEVAEHVWPNRVALVLGDVVARRAFAGEHVEVVEPEIDQHFFELALAVDRAQQLRFLDVGDDLAAFALRLVDRAARHAGSLRIARIVRLGIRVFALLRLRRSTMAGPAYSRWIVCESSVSVSRPLQPRLERRVVDA